MINSNLRESTPVASPQSCSFSQSYGSMLPTSLTYFALWPRGGSPWRPDEALGCNTTSGSRSVESGILYAIYVFAKYTYAEGFHVSQQLCNVFQTQEGNAAASVWGVWKSSESLHFPYVICMCMFSLEPQIGCPPFEFMDCWFTHKRGM